MAYKPPQDKKTGRFIRNYGGGGAAYLASNPPPPMPEREADADPVVFDPATFDMANHIDAWHGPEKAERYRQLVSGEWTPPTGDLTKEQRKDVELMALAAQYDLANRKGVDLLNVLVGRDDKGFINGQFAGYDERGRPAFGRRAEIERLEAMVARREFDADGLHSNGTYYNEIGVDVRGFFGPDENGIRWNLLTNSEYSPPPNPRKWDRTLMTESMPSVAV